MKRICYIRADAGGKTSAFVFAIDDSAMLHYNVPVSEIADLDAFLLFVGFGDSSGRPGCFILKRNSPVRYLAGLWHSCTQYFNTIPQRLIC